MSKQTENLRVNRIINNDLFRETGPCCGKMKLPDEKRLKKSHS